MTYSGNKLLNTNNAVLLILLLIFGYGAFTTTNTTDKYGFFAIVVTISLLITAIEAFYFEITSDQLIVKNYILFFLNVRYNLKEITSVEILSTNGRSTALARVKIVRGEKHSMGFKSASLAKEDWQAFKNGLKETHVICVMTASRLIDYVDVD